MTAVVLKTDSSNTIDLDNSISLSADMTVRVILSDEAGYGTCLPAAVVGERSISVMLPDALAPFVPDLPYVCRVEVVSDDQLSAQAIHACTVTVVRDSVVEEHKAQELAREEDPAIALIDLVIMKEGTQSSATRKTSTGPSVAVTQPTVSIDDLVREIDSLFVTVRRR